MEYLGIISLRYGEVFAQGFVIGSITSLLIIFVVTIFDIGTSLTYEYYLNDKDNINNKNSRKHKNSIKRQEHILMR